MTDAIRRRNLRLYAWSRHHALMRSGAATLSPAHFNLARQWADFARGI